MLPEPPFRPPKNESPLRSKTKLLSYAKRWCIFFHLFISLVAKSKQTKQKQSSQLLLFLLRFIKKNKIVCTLRVFPFWLTPISRPCLRDENFLKMSTEHAVTWARFCFWLRNELPFNSQVVDLTKIKTFELNFNFLTIISFFV